MATLIPPSMSFIVLAVLGFFSLGLSVSLHRRFRVLKTLSKNAGVTVFDKTFNVIDPYPDRKKMLNSLVTLLPLVIIVSYFLLGAVVLKVFESGLLPGLAIIALSLSFLAIDVVLDIRKNSSVFVKALGDGKELGKGDLDALSLLKTILPRMRTYYLVLGVLFFATFVVAPTVASFVFSSFTQFFGTMMQSSTYIGIAAPYFVVLVLAILVVAVEIGASLVKSRVFGLTKSKSLTFFGEQFERIKIMAHWAELPPYELSHRPILEDGEVEERKQKGLDSK